MIRISMCLLTSDGEMNTNRWDVSDELDVASLVQSCCSKAAYVGNVVPVDAVYVDALHQPTGIEKRSVIDPLSTARERGSHLPGWGVSATSAVAVVLEEVVTVCFHRGSPSRAIVPPGAGIPRIRVRFGPRLLVVSFHELLAVPSARASGGSDPRRRVLVVSWGNLEDWWDAPSRLSVVQTPRMCSNVPFELNVSDRDVEYVNLSSRAVCECKGAVAE